MAVECPFFVPEHSRPLPPLILHPFCSVCGPDSVAASARASLILQGLLPGSEFGCEELNLRLLDGRYGEIRMLYYVGKDVARWLDQCSEVVARDAELRGSEIRRQSFAHLLVNEAPATVQEKLVRWGVSDYRSLFGWALGLHAVFGELPERDSLAENFVRHHQRYAGAFFDLMLEAAPFAHVRAVDFPFELYASGEYTKLLEAQWEQS